MLRYSAAYRLEPWVRRVGAQGMGTQMKQIRRITTDLYCGLSFNASTFPERETKRSPMV
ncbi:hypothetical protein K5X82_17075 [Halosquirtibacter xylanolyticus]|uniref:hypothetical protein n=1 Tax=Halosquirtibacter xylanolyticus TaxID=3374599 RepID=UPI00374986E0|nr:hypothetical protein K5X82_17075 [Prolixibacteraceae bacterium]